MLCMGKWPGSPCPLPFPSLEHGMQPLLCAASAWKKRKQWMLGMPCEREGNSFRWPLPTYVVLCKHPVGREKGRGTTAAFFSPSASFLSQAALETEGAAATIILWFAPSRSERDWSPQWRGRLERAVDRLEARPFTALPRVPLRITAGCSMARPPLERCCEDHQGLGED